MDRPALAHDLLHALELRVFEGPQTGARAPMVCGTDLVLATGPEGHGIEADIVLREEGVTPARVRVTADLTDALIEVLAGEIRLGERVLTAGTQSPWAMHSPLRIGSAVVAFGRAAVADWPVAIAQAEAADAAKPTATVTRARAPLHLRAEVWLAGLGATVLLFCLAAFWTARSAATPLQTPDSAPPSLAAELRASEFSGLTITTGVDGHMTVHGRIGTLAQRARLDAWLAEHQVAPVIDVQVDEALVRDVTETFRVNGVSVQAQVSGMGTIAVEAAERDADRLARAEEVVRRDVRGVTDLAVRNVAPPAPKPVRQVSDDPGKRIASLVPGDPAYLVTADGSRYFVGSMLPTGHRITRIAAGSVTLELDGQQTTLNF